MKLMYIDSRRSNYNERRQARVRNTEKRGSMRVIILRNCHEVPIFGLHNFNHIRCIGKKSRLLDLGCKIIFPRSLS